MPLSDQKGFPRLWHGVHKFSSAPRELQGKTILFVKGKPWRPHRVLIVLLRSSHCVLPRFYGGQACDSKRLHDFHCACAALLMYTLRFHGVRTALPRRSGTALTACRQNGNEVSVICTFCFQEYPLLSALASVC